MRTGLVILCSVVCLFFASCGSYRYYMPTANPALFQEAGEVNVAGDIGSSGVSAKGSVSITNHIAVMGQYANGLGRYRSRDYEFAAGYYRTKEKHCDFFAAGVGWGNNWGYHDTTYTNIDYQGHFIRPFIQINSGVTGAKLFWKVKGDAMLGLKASYFMYSGQNLDGAGHKLGSSYMLTEPFFMWGIGGRVFHFDIIAGFPLHLTFEGLNREFNARTVPANISFGMRFLFGRKKDSE